MPSKVLHGKSPREILFGVAPDLSRLKVFRCLCFAKKKKNLHIKNKFDQCARAGIFIGYPFGQKGYHIYDIESKTIYVSRDAIFLRIFFLIRMIHCQVFQYRLHMLEIIYF